MKLAGLVLLSALVLVVALGGCQQVDTPNASPAPAAIERANLAIAPSLLTLARNPKAFKGQDLRLAGNYKPLPVPVCSDETHLSPASWALTDGEIEILASGFDGALRDLAPPGLPLEVVGSWQQWEGPVGCGRRAPSQMLWYLQLTNILSPNPLSASVPFTPAPGEPSATAIADAAPSEVVLTPASSAVTAIAENPDTNVVVTPTSGLSGTITPQVAGTPGGTAVQNGSVTPSSVSTPTGSGTLTATPPGTATTTSNTLTPAPTATSDSAGPTPSPTTSRPILLDYDDLSKRTIEADGVHKWQFAGATGLAIVIKVAPSSELDVALELLDPSSVRLDSIDATGEGQTETIDIADLPATGLYTLQVSAAGQTNGSYALVLQSDSSLPIVQFQGIMGYGETRSGTTPVDGDHLWNFEGIAGDLINIRVVATTSTDMQIYFNNYDGQETEFVNDNTVFSPPNDREEILGLRLPATGLYTIGIGEEDLEELGYTILIERAS